MYPSSTYFGLKVLSFLGSFGPKYILYGYVDPSLRGVWLSGHRVSRLGNSVDEKPQHFLWLLQIIVGVLGFGVYIYIYIYTIPKNPFQSV